MWHCPKGGCDGVMAMSLPATYLWRFSRISPNMFWIPWHRIFLGAKMFSHQYSVTLGITDEMRYGEVVGPTHLWKCPKFWCFFPMIPFLIFCCLSWSNICKLHVNTMLTQEGDVIHTNMRFFIIAVHTKIKNVLICKKIF